MNCRFSISIYKGIYPSDNPLLPILRLFLVYVCLCTSSVQRIIVYKGLLSGRSVTVLLPLFTLPFTAGKPQSTGRTSAESFDDSSPRHPHGCHPCGPALYLNVLSYITSLFASSFQCQPSIRCSRFCHTMRYRYRKRSSARSSAKKAIFPTSKVTAVRSRPASFRSVNN